MSCFAAIGFEEWGYKGKRNVHDAFDEGDGKRKGWLTVIPEDDGHRFSEHGFADLVNGHKAESFRISLFLF